MIRVTIQARGEAGQTVARVCCCSDTKKS